MSRIFFEQIDDALVNNLRNTSSYIKNVSRYSDSIVSSPITGLIATTNPEFLPVYAGMNVGNKFFKAIGSITDGLAGIADRNNYKKVDTYAKTATNTLERVSKIVKDVSDTGFKFV